MNSKKSVAFLCLRAKCPEPPKMLEDSAHPLSLFQPPYCTWSLEARGSCILLVLLGAGVPGTSVKTQEMGVSLSHLCTFVPTFRLMMREEGAEDAVS